MKKQENIGGGLIPGLSRHARKGAFACLLAATVTTGGCYGRFPLTHAVYQANGEIGNKVLRNVAFWLLAWFPVYFFAAVIDAVIPNLIDFWTGSDLDVHLHVSSADGNGGVTLTSSEDRKTLFMTVTKTGEPDVKISFVRVEDGKYDMRDGNNTLTGKVLRTADGNLNLTDAQGNTLRTINPTEIASVAGK